MVGQLVKTVYKYADVELVSGAVVNAPEVHIIEGKVKQINSCIVKVGDKQFSCSINPQYMMTSVTTDTLTYNMNGVPEDVDAQAILKEFVDFVEADIV